MNRRVRGVDLLRELCRLPKETEWVEFKQDRWEPEEVGEYISALANSAALDNRPQAYLVWGVENDTHRIVGTTFRPSMAKKGSEELENWLCRLLEPQVSVKFFEVEVEGQPCSIIQIGQANGQPVQFKGVEYIRVGSYKKKLKDHPEKAKELWRSFDRIPFERRVALSGLDASRVLELLDYPGYFELIKLPLPENRSGILDALESESMIQKGADGLWSIFNLGAILLAKNLTRFPGLERKVLRLVSYEGDGRVETYREITSKSGYAVGFEPVIQYLKDNLPENEVIGDAFRRSVPMYPELAVRELVANVIIHQNFTVTGAGPMVEIFATRLEITNPGIPLVETNRFLDSPPRSRNEGLAAFMRRVGVCEERGSGIDKVVYQTELFQLPPPRFEVISGQTRAMLFAHKPFNEMDRDERVWACYLHACLQFVQRNRMTNSTLRERFGIEQQNRAQVTRVINDALSSELIRPYNPDSSSRRHASYVPFWA